MKLFAVMYIHAHMVTAMFLWNGATMKDCQVINAAYSHDLDMDWQDKKKDLDHNPILVDPFNKSYHLHRKDVVLTCEWHKTKMWKGFIVPDNWNWKK
jgi:hypothetical protein